MRGRLRRQAAAMLHVLALSAALAAPTVDLPQLLADELER
jgi:hypothetical protein